MPPHLLLTKLHMIHNTVWATAFMDFLRLWRQKNSDLQRVVFSLGLWMSYPWFPFLPHQLERSLPTTAGLGTT